ncbi:MAG: hypothetical protein GOVbin2833_32 [Prokaryotic dsDNA virus sp.]|nr:MAG: hypothetical protein GOVbin2833_32 [Prokaryotic dsDNA virus sp.]|tara:strand:- start:6674 stop:6985 length:312 start_codon:yes stop_codon:yes gene_type:complete
MVDFGNRFKGTEDSDWFGDFCSITSEIEEDHLNPHVPKILELALEYMKEDDEFSGIGYVQTSREEFPWVVVAAGDPVSLLKLVIELMQTHCKEFELDDFIEEL